MGATENVVSPLIVKDKVDTVFDLNALKTAEFGDQSSFHKSAWNEKTGLQAQLDKLSKAVQPWHVGQTQADNAVRDIGKADIAVRRLILNEKGEPDYAGNTYAYASAFNAYFTKYMSDAGLGTEAVKRLRGKVREYRSANQLTLAAVALDVVSKDKALADTTVNVKGKEITIKQLVTAADKGDVLADQAEVPKSLAKAIDAVYATQTNKTGSKRLNGFESVPAKFGVKQRQTNPGTPTDKALNAIESAGAVFAGSKITAVQKVIEFGYVWTDLLDSFVGKPSDLAKETPEPDMLDSDAVLSKLSDIHAAIGLFIEYKTDGDTQLTRKDIVALGMRRQEG